MIVAIDYHAPPVSANLLIARQSAQPGQTFASSPPVPGALAAPGNAASAGANNTGQMQTIYGQMWYHRIHIVPAVVNLGSVATHQVRNFEVWNAHFSAKTLTSIDSAGDASGLAITGQPAPPLDFGPLCSRMYALHAHVNGAPLIDVRYIFGFGGDSPVFAVTGLRLAIWALRPNWAGGVTERMEWATDVMPAYAGVEQRVRLRQHARRSLEMDFAAAGHEARRAENLLFGWGGRKYCVPIWPERERLGAPVAQGATSVTVSDAALKDYRVGGFVVFWSSESRADALEIESIAGDLLTLSAPVARSYPAGASVCPGIVARLDGETPLRRSTDALIEGRVRFLDEDARDRAPAEIGPIYDGYAVLDERPDRALDVDERWARTLEVLDNLSGLVTIDDATRAPVIRRSLSWLIAGRAAIHKWKRWAAARAGRANALWLPTHADDMHVTADIGAGDTAITVRHADAARLVGMHPMRSALRLELADGTIIHRRITGVSELSEHSEMIGINSALGFAVPTANVRRAMWLQLARLDADALEFRYETDSIVRLTTTFRIVAQ